MQPKSQVAIGVNPKLKGIDRLLQPIDRNMVSKQPKQEYHQDYDQTLLDNVYFLKSKSYVQQNSERLKKNMEPYNIEKRSWSRIKVCLKSRSHSYEEDKRTLNGFSSP